MAIESLPRRVTDLEERESILYGFMNDLRIYTKKIDERLDQYEALMAEMKREHEERTRQNEEGLREQRELMRAIMLIHADSLKQIHDVRGRVNGIEDRMGEAGKSQV
jgi:hypothetical protein